MTQAEPAKNERRWAPLGLGLLAVIAIVLVGMALRETYAVSMPVALATFLAVIVYPIQYHVNRHVSDRFQWVGTATALMLVLVVLAAAMTTVTWSISKAAQRAPQYYDRLQAKWSQLVQWAAQHDIYLQQQVIREELRSHLMNFVTAGITSLWWWLAIIVIVFFLVLLMLLEVREWQGKTREAVRPEHASHAKTVTRTIADQVRQYLLVRTAMSLISGVAGGLWLLLIGIDFWYLWALTIFLLNYIPNLGSVLAIVPPALIALLQFDWGWALLTVAGLTAIEQVIGNFLDPRMQGRTLDISPLVVLVAILLWAWIWGVVGMLLAVPITATLIVICQQVDWLRPVADLLARSPHGPVPRPGDEPEGEDTGT